MRHDIGHVIDLEGAAYALVLRARRHHEVFDVKLTASLKQLGQSEFSVRPIEQVILLDPDPWQSQALGRDKIAVARQSLLVLEEFGPRIEPFLSGNNPVLHAILLPLACTGLATNELDAHGVSPASTRLDVG
jgi:hypothetical protein